MASKVEAVPGLRGCGDAEDASSDAGETDGRDDDDGGEGIPARGTVDRDSADRADKPEPEDSGTGAAPRPSRNAIDRALRHPSSRSDHPWSAEPRRRHMRSNGHGTPSLWLASPAPRPGSLRGIGHIVSYCQTF